MVSCCRETETYMFGGASPTRTLLLMKLKELQDDGVFLYMSTIFVARGIAVAAPPVALSAPPGYAV